MGGSYEEMSDEELASHLKELEELAKTDSLALQKTYDIKTVQRKRAEAAKEAEEAKAAKKITATIKEGALTEARRRIAEKKAQTSDKLSELYDEEVSDDLKRGVMGRLARSKAKIFLTVVAGGILGAGAMVGAKEIGIGNPGYALFVGLAPLIITGMKGFVRMKGDHELADECEQAKDSGSAREMAKVIQKLQAKYPDQTTTVTTSAAEQQGVIGELEDAANSAAASDETTGNPTTEENDPSATAGETSSPAEEGMLPTESGMVIASFGDQGGDTFYGSKQTGRFARDKGLMQYSHNDTEMNKRLQRTVKDARKTGKRHKMSIKDTENIIYHYLTLKEPEGIDDDLRLDALNAWATGQYGSEKEDIDEMVRERIAMRTVGKPS